MESPEKSGASQAKSTAVYAWIICVAAMLIVLLLSGFLLQALNTPEHSPGVTIGTDETLVTSGQGRGGENNTGSGGDGTQGSDIAGTDGGEVVAKNPASAEMPDISSPQNLNTTDTRQVTTLEPVDSQVGMIDEKMQTPVESPIALTGQKTSPGKGVDNAALTGRASPRTIFQDSKTAHAKRIVYIIDSSGSMDGQRIDLAKSELSKSLKALNAQQYFYVLFFSGAVKPMPADTMLNGTPANRKKIDEWLAKVNAGGNTEVAGALEMALEKNPDVIWLLTDGMIQDSRKARDILEGYAKKYPGRKFRLNTIAFIDRGGEVFLKELSAKYGGTYKYVAK